MSIINPLDRGLFTVSVDLAGRTSIQVGGRTQLEEVRDWLLAAFSRHGMVATWGVADPASCPLVGRVMDSNPCHEVAVLGDASWVGSAVGRGTFSKELSRRVVRARAGAFRVTTLLTRETLVEDHIDLLVKHQISAVRGGMDERRRLHRPAPPRPLHYGLWEIPGSLRLPGDQRFVLGGGRWNQARRGILRAATKSTVYHLVIDGCALAESTKRARRRLEMALRVASRLHQQGRLFIDTLIGTTDRLAWNRPSTPSRSILRRA